MDFSNFQFLSFDCYGTLIDWEQGILNALADPFDQFATISKTDVIQSFAKWEAKIEAGPYQHYAQVLKDVLRGMCSDFSIHLDDYHLLSNSVANWQPFPDTIAALQQLQTKFELVILSNIDQFMFAETSKLLQCSFHLVCTAEEIGSYKPDRRNFEFMVQKLGGDTSKILHVAQSLYHDHVPAQELGLRSVWVNRPSIVPGQGATLPVDVQVDGQVGSMSELVDLLG